MAVANNLKTLSSNQFTKLKNIEVFQVKIWV